MSKPYILPYKSASESAKALAEALGTKRIKLEGSKFVHKDSKVVCNWGNNVLPSSIDSNLPSLNCVDLKKVTNKLNFFNKMNSIMPECIPDYTTDIEAARLWCREGSQVVCRKLLNASSGRGIVITGVAEDVVQAPLYTKYIKKKEEYRVHVFRGTVIDIQRKMRKTSVDDEAVNWRVRNLSGGFIFGRNDITPPEGIEELSINCINALGLDFGAVDIIWNEKRGKMYLLEVNTAPGLQGTTLEKYKQAIEDFCSGKG